jgi:hypothetical protein
MSGADAAGPEADAAIADLRALARVLERDLFAAVLALDTEPGEATLLRRQTTAAVLRQVSDRLRLAGEEAISVAGARALAAVEAVYGAPPSTLPLDVRAELDAIMDRQMADVVKVFDGAQRAMRDAVSRGVLTGGSLADVVAEVQEVLRITSVQAQAAVDAAVMAAGRRAVMAAAADIEDTVDLVYVYVGPKDAKNRPFCRTWVGKAATNPERLDNGQGLPVDDYCGGYNCRHSWAPTLVENALAEGYRIFDTSGGRDDVDVTEALRLAPTLVEG